MENTLDAISSKMDKFVPGLKLGFATRGLKKGARVMNEALWDNLHEPLKLLNWEHQVAKLSKNPAFSHLPKEEIERMAAKFTNDAFGGQNWAALGVNPRFQQILHWALLAPDWTISNARISGIGTTGIKGLARGIIGKGRNPSESMVGAYWRTAIPTMYGAMNLLNKSLSGKWMWENPPGNQLEVNLGSVDEEGRPEFMKLGKQMREPFRWLTDPLSIGGGKASPLAKEVVEQLSGRSPGSQFPTEFAKDFNKKPQSLVEQIPARVGNVLAKFEPFILSGKSVWLAFPKASLTQTKVENALIETLNNGKVANLLRATGAKNSKTKDVRAILTIAASSGMDVGRILGNVKRKIGDEAGVLQTLQNQGHGAVNE